MSVQSLFSLFTADPGCHSCSRSAEEQETTTNFENTNDKDTVENISEKVKFFSSNAHYSVELY